MSSTSYKIIIVGDTGVGKTAFVSRHLSKDFETNHIKTMGAEVRNINFTTDKGCKKISLWDCAGDKKFRGPGDGYYYGADAAIIMFDITDNKSYENINTWLKEIKYVKPDIPIVICGNKIEYANKKFKFNNFKIQYYDISVKSKYNCEKPIQYLLSKLCDKKSTLY